MTTAVGAGVDDALRQAYPVNRTGAARVFGLSPRLLWVAYVDHHGALVVRLDGWPWHVKRATGLIREQHELGPCWQEPSGLGRVRVCWHLTIEGAR